MGAIICGNQNAYGVHDLANREGLRPFLIQSNLSVENGLFQLKPKSSFLTQSKKRFFDSTFFDWEFRLADPVEKVECFDCILQSKNSVGKVLHVFFEPIASFIPPPNTHPHSHTATYHPYLVPQCSIMQGAALAWLSLLLLLAASRRGAFPVPLASSVYHKTAAARGIDSMLPTTSAPAVALAALG